MTDDSYIKLAIEIAKKGKGSVSPNPLVGCVIVKDERIISAGYHEKFGENHAEVNAIESSKESVEGSTMYINLEPCSHHGKTPPCVDKIINSKISKVVIGTLDMNPLVSGKGVKKLKNAGIDVKVGVLEKDCIALNKFFFKSVTEKTPYITLKIAQTIDGKIADEENESKWISSLSSRKLVHSFRAEYDAVLVGYGTVKIDNPSLTVRLSEGRNPYRIILDYDLKVKTSSQVLKNNSDKKVIILTSKKNKEKTRKVNSLEKNNIRIIFVNDDKNGGINIRKALKEINKLGISSVLVEGGSEVYSSFIKKKLFDDLFVFVTPKLLGNGIPVIQNIGINNIKKALKLKIKNFEKIGDDLLVELSK